MRQIPDPFLVGNLPAKKFEGILKGNFSKFPLSRRRLFYAFPHPRLNAGEAGTRIHELSKSYVEVVTACGAANILRPARLIKGIASALCLRVRLTGSFTRHHPRTLLRPDVHSGPAALQAGVRPTSFPKKNTNRGFSKTPAPRPAG